jgi:threonine aldolase
MESTHLTFISRVTPRPIASRRGAMDPEDVERNIRTPSVHSPRTSLICLENTHNNWSGAVIPLDNFRAIREVADRNGVKIHLDGARLFNAAAASGVPVKEYAALVDSVMFCLSKGLSAPVGSLLVGPREFIDTARRVRKALGGGMRQSGVLAAPGIIALTVMTKRLGEDHGRAKRLAAGIAGLPGVSLDPASIETNILIFGFSHPRLTCAGLLDELGRRRVLALSIAGGLRLVTHKDVDDEDVDRAVAAFREILS